MSTRSAVPIMFNRIARPLGPDAPWATVTDPATEGCRQLVFVLAGRAPLGGSVRCPTCCAPLAVSSGAAANSTPRTAGGGTMHVSWPA